MDQNRFKALWCIVFALCSGGGGKAPPPPIVPASGVVLLNGAPLPHASVRFIPNIKFGAQYIATGVTDEQGNYALQCNGQPGACATENTVTVTEADLPSHLKGESSQGELAIYLRSLQNRPIPRLYASAVSSPLRFTVTDEQSQYNIELKR
jgi:hypothetical protein